MKFTVIILFLFCVSVYSDQSDDECSKIIDHKVPNNGTNVDVDNAFKNLQEQKSLVIVFDTTGSMTSDLESLRQAAIRIVKDFGHAIENYVLAEFNDPVVPEVFTTIYTEEFLQKLNEIDIDGGGDCPELTIEGIRRGMEAANEFSIVYVFTDATAKDFHLKDAVIDLVREKRLTVDFFSTGSCGDNTQIGFTVFHDISAAGGGQVFQIRRYEIDPLLDALECNLDPACSPLISEHFDENVESETKINVDSTFKTLTISVAGSEASLSIKNSKNEEVEPANSLKLKNVKLLTFDVDDTIYQISASAKSSYTVKAVGITDLIFQYGFSVDLPNSISSTTTLPLTNSENYFSIFPSDISLVKCITKVTISSVFGAFSDYDLNTIQYGDSFLTEYNKFPKQSFKIQILGWDINGERIDRTILIELISVDAKPPRVVKITHDFSPSLHIRRGSDFDVSCEYESMITAYAVGYYFVEESSKIELKGNISPQSDTFIMTSIRNFNEDHVGYYECLVSNDLGDSSRKIKLQIAPFVEITNHPKPIEASDGENVLLKCDVKDGRPKYNIQWSIGSQGQSHSDITETTFTDTYNINTNLLLNGKTVTCWYSDNHGEYFSTSDATTLRVSGKKSRMPNIEREPEKNVEIGEEIELECLCQNCLPITKATWSMNRLMQNYPEKFSSDEIDLNTNTFKSTLKLGGATKISAGIYWCEFENKWGTDKKEIRVNLLE